MSANSAYPAGGLHRAVPSYQRPAAAFRSMWLHEIKHDGFRVIARKNRQAGEALQPAGQ